MATICHVCLVSGGCLPPAPSAQAVERRPPSGGLFNVRINAAVEPNVAYSLPRGKNCVSHITIDDCVNTADVLP